MRSNLALSALLLALTPLLVTSALAPQKPHRVPTVMSGMQKLEMRQLEAWRAQGNIEVLKNWAQNNHTQALEAIHELVVDRYASAWLLLEPQYPNSPLLLALLSKETGVQVPAAADCKWELGQLDPYEYSEPGPVCQNLPGYDELASLSGLQGSPFVGNMHDLPTRYIVVASSLSLPDSGMKRSLRGRVQDALLEGQSGLDFSSRRRLLADALALARAQHFSGLEALLLLALARLEFDALRHQTYVGPALNPAPSRQRAESHIRQAQMLAEALHSTPLQADVALLRARWAGEKTAFGEATRLIQALPVAARDAMELELADAWMVSGSEHEAYQLYGRLQAQATRPIRQQVTERLEYMSR